MVFDMLILGAGCAGLTAALYAGRGGLTAAVIEKAVPGGQAAITSQIDNYPGLEGITGPEFSQRLFDQATRFGAEVITGEAKSLSLMGDVKTIVTDTGSYQGRTVILASGASPKALEIPGEKEYLGRGVSYCATCDGFFFKGKEVVVVGGGYSAAEEALFLTRFAAKVTIAVRKEAFRCSRPLAEKVLGHPKIRVLFHTQVIKAWGDALLKGVTLQSSVSREELELSSPQGLGLFIFVGYQPQTKLLEGSLPLNQAGYVSTNDRMETAIPGVFAAGDLRAKPFRQLITAASDGAIAAAQAEKYLSS